MRPSGVSFFAAPAILSLVDRAARAMAIQTFQARRCLRMKMELAPLRSLRRKSICAFTLLKKVRQPARRKPFTARCIASCLFRIHSI